jgi:simple sugar transport system permease protein
MGWIALAIVIFGGWHPVKATVGACLFSFLQVAGIPLQSYFSSVPTQVFQVAPFPVMIFILVGVHLAQGETVERWAEDRPWVKRWLQLVRAAAPRALGRPFRRE